MRSPGDQCRFSISSVEIISNENFSLTEFGNNLCYIIRERVSCFNFEFALPLINCSVNVKKEKLNSVKKLLTLWF